MEGKTLFCHTLGSRVLCRQLHKAAMRVLLSSAEEKLCSYYCVALLCLKLYPQGIQKFHVFFPLWKGKDSRRALFYQCRNSSSLN